MSYHLACGTTAQAPRPGRPAHRHAPPAGPRRPVRLTRRGRIVLAVLLFGLMVAAGALVASAGTAGEPTRAVVVGPGDTLWSLAARYTPSDDPVDAVERIRHLNHLHGYTIYPGERLELPTSG